jgi:cytidylate kinase
MSTHPASGRPVVTISAPYGAGGSVVGPRLAERLDVEFIDRAIPRAVAVRLGIPEHEAVTYEELPHDSRSRLMSSFASAAAMFAGAPLPHLSPADDENWLRAVEAALVEHAQDGAVLLGRAGAIVLRDVPGALHVRLTAPRERRVEQAMAIDDVDRATAEVNLQAADLAREAYVQHWYRVDPASPQLYHLVIDSSAISLDGCVDLIVLALERRLMAAAGAGDGAAPAG